MNANANRPAPVICIVGARPNYMKVAPIIRAFAAHTDPEVWLAEADAAMWVRKKGR